MPRGWIITKILGDNLAKLTHGNLLRNTKIAFQFQVSRHIPRHVNYSLYVSVAKEDFSMISLISASVK